MWIPEVIFCVAMNCWAANAPPQDTKELCDEYIVTTMIPVILYTVPGVMIHSAGCKRDDIPV